MLSYSQHLDLALLAACAARAKSGKRKKEDKMSNLYLIFKHSSEKGVTKDGGILEWSHGCNGSKHADCLNQVFRNLNGDVEYAISITIVERGPCDQTCGIRGWFVHPSTADKVSPRV